jgi:quercetin dioxygenase-like cupin family protein
MKRREMLGGLAMAMGTAWLSADAQEKHEAFVLKPDESLSGGLLNSGGNKMHLLLRSDDSNGRCSILDNVTDPGAGPPLHTHEREDEWFYVMSGEYAVQVGKQVYRLKAGATAFGPRGVPHAFECVSAEPGRMMTVFTPGGIEGFFVELTAAGHPTPEMAAKYGMTVVGPPLKEAVG